MAELTPDKNVKFCYLCGRRVDGTRESCWYCGSEIHRRIRPPKVCQFCGSEVPHGAVKCKHCGEFLDGRAAAAPPPQPPPQQVVYVVDRQLLQSAQDLKLLAGQPIPADVSRQLSDQTRRAIETGQPAMIDMPTVRALPAPESGVRDVIDVQPEAGGEAPRALPSPSRDVAVRGASGSSGASVPARREDSPGGQGSGAAGKALAKLGQFLISTAPGARPRPEPTIPVAEDAFRTCESCGAEIMATDCFCFHCGFQYHTTASERIAKRRSSRGMSIYVVIALMMAGLLALRILPVPDAADSLAFLLAGLTGLMCVIAFFLRRTFFNQALAISLLVMTMAILLFG